MYRTVVIPRYVPVYNHDLGRATKMDVIKTRNSDRLGCFQMFSTRAVDYP